MSAERRALDTTNITKLSQNKQHSRGELQSYIKFFGS